MKETNINKISISNTNKKVIKMENTNLGKYLCPSCGYALNVKPIPEFCPECGTPTSMYEVLLGKLEQITCEVREIKEILVNK